MRLSCPFLVALVGGASVGACAGSPVEAVSGGGTAESSGDATASSITSNDTSVSTSSTASSAGDPTSASASETSADVSTNPSGDPTSASSESSGDVTSSTQEGGTSSDGGTRGESSSSSEGDEASGGGDGGCLGDPLPEVAPLECSIRSATPAALEIENTCAFSVEVFWVNYECLEEAYQVISSNNTWSTGSFETHPWRIRNMETGDLIVEIPPLLGDTNIVVQ